VRSGRADRPTCFAGSTTSSPPSVARTASRCRGFFALKPMRTAPCGWGRVPPDCSAAERKAGPGRSRARAARPGGARLRRGRAGLFLDAVQPRRHPGQPEATLRRGRRRGLPGGCSVAGSAGRPAQRRMSHGSGHLRPRQRRRLWFATEKGVAAVDPADFHLNSQPPPVQVEAVTYHVPATRPEARERRAASASSNGEVRVSAPFANPLRVPPGTYGLDVEFAALSFSAPEKVRFQYQLEGSGCGLERYRKDRVVRFHQLPPGQYVFRVRAANNDGIWNSTGASLTIRRDLAHEDVARLHVGADAHDAALVEVHEDSSETFGISRVISSWPRFVSRTCSSSSWMWMDE